MVPAPERVCCISLGQRHLYFRSTGAPRHCLGAPDLLEQENVRLGKSYPIMLELPGPPLILHIISIRVLYISWLLPGC